MKPIPPAVINAIIIPIQIGTPDSTRNYTVLGTKGRLENIGDSGRCRIEVHTTRQSGMKEADQIHQLFPLEGSHGGSDPLIIKSFIDFIRDDVQPNTNPVAAREAVAAGLAATESLRENNIPKQIPELDPKLVSYYNNGQKH